MLAGVFLARQNGGGVGVTFTFPCVGRPGGTVVFTREIEKNDGLGFRHVLLIESNREGYFKVKSLMEWSRLDSVAEDVDLITSYITNDSRKSADFRMLAGES